MRAGSAAALAAVLAGGALTGCDTATKAGTAALIDGDRITVAELHDTVGDWWAQVRTDPRAARRLAAGDDGRGESADGPTTAHLQRALSSLVSFRLTDELAERTDVSVSDGQVDGILSVMDRNGGAETIALANGLPRERVRDMARFSAVQDALLGHFGIVRTPQTEQELQQVARFNALVDDTVTDLDIEINPRYGEFDPRKMGILPVSYKLSTPGTGSSQA